jgi:TolA-binding protein
MTELLNSIDSQVQSEIKKGHQKKQVDKSSNIKQKQKVIDKGPHIFNKEESVVVAQLKDELEKKNDTIEKLKKNATKMEAEMNEVKVRNQVLCKMMSSGEFATKFKLLEEIEELTADKVDLTSEVSWSRLLQHTQAVDVLSLYYYCHCCSLLLLLVIMYLNYELL